MSSPVVPGETVVLGLRHIAVHRQTLTLEMMVTKPVVIKNKMQMKLDIRLVSLYLPEDD